METGIRVSRFIKRLRRRARGYWVRVASLKSLGVFLYFIAVLILADAAFGLPLAWRSGLRWAAGAATLGILTWVLWRNRRAFRTEQAIREVEGYFAQEGRHDPLLSAWSFLREENKEKDWTPASAGVTQSEVRDELIGREIERALEFAKRIGKRLPELYGFKPVLRRAGVSFLAAFFLAPALIWGAGAVSGMGAKNLLWRLWDPYRHLVRVFEAIEMEPPPGRYRPVLGSPQTIRIKLNTAKPAGWGAPKVELEGELHPMAAAGAQEDYQYTLPGILQPVELRVVWGEFESKPWIFDPVSLPAVEEIVFQIKPPAHAPRLAKKVEGTGLLSALEGSSVEAQGRASVEILAVEVLRQDSGAESQAAVARINGREFIFSLPSLQPAGQENLRIALTDRAGRKNPQAAVIALEVLQDQIPSVSILEPVFGEVQMDLEGELPLVWEAWDEAGLNRVEGVLEFPNGVLRRKPLWNYSGPAHEAPERMNKIYTFRPRAWAMKNGDRAVLTLAAWDNLPGRREGASSRESVAITVTDFSSQHRQNLENTQASLKEALMSHLEQGLELSGRMESGLDPGLAQELQKYDSQSKELAGKLQEHAKFLEQDPLASPKWSWGVRNVAQNLEEARSSHLEPAQKASGQNNREQASKELGRYMEEMEKAATAFEELGKEQKMTDAVGSSQRLEELTDSLVNQLNDAQSVEELENILADLDREFQELSKALSKMTPEEFPQEFVNQLPPEDLPMGEVADAKSELAQALQKGDLKAAKEAAKRMLESLKKMRQNLEEAAQEHQKKPENLLGSPQETGEEEKPSIGRDIEAIRQGQEELLWKTSAVEQEFKKRAAGREAGAAPEKLTQKETEALKSQAAEQKGLMEKTKKALSEMAQYDRDHPTLLLGRFVTKLDEAVKAQEKAAGNLEGAEPSQSTASENEALKKLQELQDGLEQLKKDMENMPSAGRSSGGGKPLLVLPSGGSSGRQEGGSKGIHLGPVRIPKPEDYKVPAERRNEILKSLQEKRPRSMEEEVGEYLKSLLK